MNTSIIKTDVIPGLLYWIVGFPFFVSTKLIMWRSQWENKNMNSLRTLPLWPEGDKCEFLSSQLKDSLFALIHIQMSLLSPSFVAFRAGYLQNCSQYLKFNTVLSRAANNDRHLFIVFSIKCQILFQNEEEIIRSDFLFSFCLNPKTFTTINHIWAAGNGTSWAFYAWKKWFIKWLFAYQNGCRLCFCCSSSSETTFSKKYCSALEKSVSKKQVLCYIQTLWWLINLKL